MSTITSNIREKIYLLSWKKKVEDTDALITLVNVGGRQLTSVADDRERATEDALIYFKSELLALFAIKAEKFLF